MITPQHIEIIGDFVAIRWSDGREDALEMETLRRMSPSAENMGERDLLGKRIGGDGRTDFSGVRVTGWSAVGSYAVGFTFSDGHRTGIYPFHYLRDLADAENAPPDEGGEGGGS